MEVFNFGKHKGKPVEQVFKEEPSYYSWMMNGDFPLNTKQVLTAIKVTYVSYGDRKPVLGRPHHGGLRFQHCPSGQVGGCARRHGADPRAGRFPKIVTREMVCTMKPRSVIMDVSIDQGGCVKN